MAKGPGNKRFSDQRPARVITAETQSTRMASDRKSHQLAETVSSKQHECPVTHQTGTTLRDGTGREVGPGRMGDTCTPVADSCQCMAKKTTVL